MLHRMTWSGLLAVVFFALVEQPAWAALKPHSSVQQMCFQADLIIAGRHRGEGQVEVTRYFFRQPVAEAVGLPEEGEAARTLRVKGLEQHDLRPGWPIIREGDAQASTLQPDHVYLFLKVTVEDQLEPIYMHGHGSQGVVWVAQDQCYRYEQWIRPGPYVLTKVGPMRPADPMSEDALVEAIQIGLALRHQWEAIAAIKNEQRRAEAVVAFILPTTGPRALKPETLSLRATVQSLGKEAASPLIAALAPEHLDAIPIDDVVLSLHDVGHLDAEAIRPAVGTLMRLLETPPDGASPYYLLAAVKAAGDPRAVEVVRPYLDHESGQVRGQAARALAAMHDRASYEKIAQVFEQSLDAGQPMGETLELANALFKLDRERAIPLIQAAEQRLEAGISAFIQSFPR